MLLGINDPAALQAAKEPPFAPPLYNLPYRGDTIVSLLSGGIKGGGIIRASAHQEREQGTGFFTNDLGLL